MALLSFSCCDSFAADLMTQVPMKGFEPIPRFSRERILSPLRLPFRHIGAAACILNFF